MMEGKVTIRGVDWEFYSHPRYEVYGQGPTGTMFCCLTHDKLNMGHRLPGDGYCGGFPTMGEAIEVAVGISARTNPYPDEVFDA